MLSKHLYRGILPKLLRENPKANYLEIGAFDGEGVALLCKTFPDRMFYAVDPFIEDGNTVHTTHANKGDSILSIKQDFLYNTRACKNLTYFDMTSAKFFNKNLYNVFSIDILFIDGDHSFEGLSLDLSLAAAFAAKNPIHVVADDIDMLEVQQGLEIFAQKYNITPTPVPFHKSDVTRAVYFYLSL